MDGRSTRKKSTKEPFLRLHSHLPNQHVLQIALSRRSASQLLPCSISSCVSYRWWRLFGLLLVLWHESVLPSCHFLCNRLTGQLQSGPSKPAKAQTSPSSPTIPKKPYTVNSTTRTGHSTALRVPTPYTCRLPPTALLPVSATLYSAEGKNASK